MADQPGRGMHGLQVTQHARATNKTQHRERRALSPCLLLPWTPGDEFALLLFSSGSISLLSSFYLTPTLRDIEELDKRTSAIGRHGESTGSLSSNSKFWTDKINANATSSRSQHQHPLSVSHLSAFISPSFQKVIVNLSSGSSFLQARGPEAVCTIGEKVGKIGACACPKKNGFGSKKINPNYFLPGRSSQDL